MARLKLSDGIIEDTYACFYDVDYANVPTAFRYLIVILGYGIEDIVKEKISPCSYNIYAKRKEN